MSILIAAYNAQEFIARAIESALAQTVLPHEIIIVNDASTDDTADVLDRFARKSELVSVHHLAVNSGPAAARNIGLDVATGDYLAILDADDAIESSFIDSIVNAIELYPAHVYATNFYWYDIARGEPLAKGLAQSEKVKEVNKYDFVKGARPYSEEADYGLLQPVFSTSFLRQNQLRYPTDIRHGEDFSLLVNLLLCDAKLVVLKAPLYLYTTRDSGFSQTIPDYPKMADETLKLCHQSSVKNDDRLVSLLKQRATALKRLNASILLNSHRQKKQYRAMASSLVSNSAYRKLMVKAVINKALRK
ncbi:glycosyltransferase family 2 protein [Salinimonas chungwhensis]|uniref:glycosyltransferase family 2 protein n=1 Tax=Salinimonas chungwhensis TaxID=265425 RepID=UPI00037430C1|nr:glycosyltransferase family 2 protein [Salinimonas chungwhensis]